MTLRQQSISAEHCWQYYTEYRSAHQIICWVAITYHI